ncbi:putative UPF0528 protein [Paratrimastix pyriformis]|uniref:UPF0528 protein n=1 Tax=Paratrimastix pyriformis TaxID=342808 RepID=A0ABQ8UP72_9EUKA|nr:putative UPF0528 protein [Paratrimastix pyriformis]
MDAGCAGYAFDEHGVLKKNGTDEGFKFTTQKVYDEIGDYVTVKIQEMMKTQLGYEEIWLPADKKPSVNVFVSPNISACGTVMLLIQGCGAVRAGQWARSLCINDTLETGSILPYLRKAAELGWGVVVFNPNLNAGVAPGGERVPIEGSSQPEEHTATVWDRVVKSRCAQARDMVIVAHSYGGICSVSLLQQREAEILPRLRAIAFTDSVHSVPSALSAEYIADLKRRYPMGHFKAPVPLSPAVSRLLDTRACNWVSASTPLDTPAGHREGCPCVSAGTPQHERTSSSAMTSVFSFLLRHLVADVRTPPVAAEEPPEMGG